jgi:hypothetical protein
MTHKRIFFGEAIEVGDRTTRVTSKKPELEGLFAALSKQEIIYEGNSHVFNGSDFIRDPTSTVVYALLQTTPFADCSKQAAFGYATLFDNTSKGLSLEFAQKLVEGLVRHYGFQVYNPNASELEEVL